MRLRFWGTRGSIPTPGPGTVRYGGNTSCVELRTPAGELILLDCGTGARPLGQALVAEAQAAGRPAHGSILLGHTHWDHIQGLPFFAPLFDPAGHWDLYGPRGLDLSLHQTLAGQMNYQYFPVTLDQLGAHVADHDLVEGTFTIGDATVRARYLNHTALTLGYRIECDGAVACYLSDHEPFDPALAAGGDVQASNGDARHVAFMAGADVVVHDAQYEAAEYATRRGWGHSTMEYVVDCAVAAEVGLVVLFHHDPSRDDAAVDALLGRARQRAAGRVEVLAAAEGHELVVKPGGRAGTCVPIPDRPAVFAPAVGELAAPVLLAVKEAAARAGVLAAASAEHLPVVDLAVAGLGAEAPPAGVVVVDLDDPSSESALDQLQGPPGAPGGHDGRPTLGVTRRVRPAAPVTLAVTDWLVWPASTAHVRTKLRAAVLRRACRWLAPALPPDEDRRLAALHALGVLDQPEQERFDRFTAAVCAALDVPVALITLVDADRQFFLSRRGIAARESARDQSVCAHAILGADVFQIPDLLQDPRFADNPAVSGPDRARFYAGAPLVLDDGSRVGTLCAVDHRPRLLDAEQLAELRRLAAEVVTELGRTATRRAGEWSRP